MKILFCANAFKSSMKILRELLPNHSISSCDMDKVEENLEEVEIAIPLMASLDRKIIEKSSFKLIQQYGVGLEGVDIEAASEKGIFVANVPSLNADSTAEHGIFLMLALARRYNETQRSMNDQMLGDPAGIGLAGKTIGIIGMGNVGRELVKRLKGFDVSIIAIKKNPSEELRKELGLDFLGGKEDLPYLLGKSDFVILCLPLTQQTRNFIGEEEFRKMKNSAYIINISRGPIIQYDALLSALKKGEIQGAGLDVFWNEPIDPKDPIFQHNVIATPHVAGWTDVSALRIGREVAKNILRIERGEIPENCVNLDRILKRISPKAS